MHVRRLFSRSGYVALLLYFVWLIPFPSFAGKLGCDRGDNCFEGIAYGLCITHANSYPRINGFISPQCQSFSGGFRALVCSASSGCAGDTYDASVYYYSLDRRCNSEPAMGDGVSQVPGDVICNNGCVMISDGHLYSPDGSVCFEVNDPDDPDNPDPDDPDNPDPDNPDDPDPDDPDDGDDKEGETASGGLGCGSMDIRCSKMDSVQCNQLVQLWYLRCRGVDLSGGDTCASPPVCSGAAQECYISRQLWEYRCANEIAPGEVAGPGASVGEGGADDTTVPTMTTVTTGQPDSSLWSTIDADSLTRQLDSSGFLGGGHCPANATFTAGRGSYTINFAPLCGVLSSAGLLVMGIAYYLAIRILLKS